MTVKLVIYDYAEQMTDNSEQENREDKDKIRGGVDLQVAFSRVKVKGSKKIDVILLS